MPTHMLEVDKPVRLPAKPVTVKISGSSGVELSALIDGRPDEHVLRPVADKMILPVIDQPVLIRATPTGGGTFGSATVITCTAELDVRGEVDSERAVLAQVDLSGLTGRDLISITPDGTRLELTSLGAVTNAALPELAAAARDLAREVLGAERAEAAHRRDLDLLVDCSASMRPLMADGSVAAALDVVTGVAQVTSDDITIRLAGATATELPQVPLAELSRASTEAALAQPLAASVRLDPVQGGSAGPRTCIVSDAVVGEPDAHWLVLVPASSWEILRHRGDPVSTAPVPEWGRGSLSERLLGDRQQLRTLVASLVSGLSGGAA